MVINLLKFCVSSYVSFGNSYFLINFINFAQVLKLIGIELFILFFMLKKIPILSVIIPPAFFLTLFTFCHFYFLCPTSNLSILQHFQRVNSSFCESHLLCFVFFFITFYSNLYFLFYIGFFFGVYLLQILFLAS